MANIQQADAESPVHYHQNNMYTHLTAYKQPEARDISGTSFFQVNIDLLLINSKNLPFVSA